MLVYDPIEKKVRTWSHAEIDGPCFVVTITSLQTGETNRAALLRCIYTLNHYLLTVKGVEIENIHMMCPPSISGKSHWIMEELLSVTSYNGLETPESTIVYRTKGSVYKIGEFDRRKKKKSRVIYSSHHLQEHKSEPFSHPTDQVTTELFGQTG
ncbi:MULTISPECIES: hypothetical protein [Pseudomonas]|jgi:hypothetical protein|uniref:hypothetical protein n=1 Tax=Pseudomonas TaxID=286 RepID=UPI00178261A4|nr:MULTISPECIES: hypothetical protein [Pseudomonas]MBD9606151.1 hypothetical protein [Pseudomonas sp. PDM08]MDR7109977.1 hypothetical protein [Pseudomonas frederiksbergensis]